jgi:hypothetical protein
MQSLFNNYLRPVFVLLYVTWITNVRYLTHRRAVPKIRIRFQCGKGRVLSHLQVLNYARQAVTQGANCFSCSAAFYLK